ILETIGRTPAVRLHRLAPPHVELYVKVEAFNPLGSVKDRLAIGVIEDAERRGLLRPGQTVVEATSGNTGIGLAMVCAQRGYPLVIVMAENFSVERRKLMRFLGAKVVLTPAAEKGTGMLRKAVELAETHGWFLTRQFENEANAEIHSKTTAREIVEDFADERLDYWVTGAGTGGTLKGVARVLRAERPDTKIVLCEPDNSPMLGSGIAQPRKPDGSADGSHPLFRPHLVQGWSPDFVPHLAEQALADKLVDRIVPIAGADALRLARELARREGIFTGISGGATLAGALTVCAEAPQGTTLLCMLPDTGERYLSTPLFESIASEMDDEELELARSTRSCRFEAAPQATLDEGAPAAPTDEAAALVQQLLNDEEHPVVMFAFEWCEFCWSVRKLFARASIPFRSIDIDSVAYQKDGRGGQIRAAVGALTGSTTIPKVFVGQELVGGATDVFDAFSDGRLQKLLAARGVKFDQELSIDAYSLLPNWLERQKR
ncbi:MAG TPA: pyridoxal-phosphate dependent enzyme, partial [Polyangiaceae bacterium]|nr:pyridoxal-phosphate dependent enzyme [Polyangiaceae bacterium]